MQLDKFEQPLEKYLEAISLTATQADTINTALEGVLALTLSEFRDARAYAQGSFSTDAMVKPLTARQGGGKAGEFDVDIAIESEEWGDAIDALDAVANAVEADDTFEGVTIDRTKNSCIRVQYPEDKTGVAFHIDLVPTKLDKDGKRWVPDRKNKDKDGGWKPSDAKQFTEWFNEKAAAQPGVRRVAKIVKRLRDLADLTDDVSSICILTLAYNNYAENGTTMGDLVSVLDGIAGSLGGREEAPQILNPVNKDEDLGERIGDYPAVRDFFVETKTALRNAIADDDANKLKEIFGPGFGYDAQGKASYAAAAAVVTPTPAFGGVADDTVDG